MARGGFDTPGLARPELVRVLESAARLQEVVPDAVLVGGSAAAPWANHRSSYDHDHVLQDLSARFDAVLDAIEATDGWVTNRVIPGKIILGELGDIESDVRQLIRNRPLEVTEVRCHPDTSCVYRRRTRSCVLRATWLSGAIRSGTIWMSRPFLTGTASLIRPTCSRISTSITPINAVLSRRGSRLSVARQLADPGQRMPGPSSSSAEYKNLDMRWAGWTNVTEVCRSWPWRWWNDQPPSSSAMLPHRPDDPVRDQPFEASRGS